MERSTLMERKIYSCTNRTKAKKISLILILFIFLLFSTFIPMKVNGLKTTSQKPEVKASSNAYILHNPIFISGNTNLIRNATSEGWSGTGTESNPIIISGYDIQVSGIQNNSITIENTNLHFIIENNAFVGPQKHNLIQWIFRFILNVILFVILMLVLITILIMEMMECFCTMFQMQTSHLILCRISILEL